MKMMAKSTNSRLFEKCGSNPPSKPIMRKVGMAKARSAAEE
jgi:hypothetical protein